MVRARLGLGAVAVSLLVVVAEFGFALYSAASIQKWIQPRGFGTLPVSLTPSFYGPVILLGLASIIGTVALHRSARNRPGWRWHVAALAPVAVFLALYRPPVSHVDDRVLQMHDAGLPWTGPAIWSTSGLALTLQIALDVAAASYVTALVLAVLRRKLALYGTATIPWGDLGDGVP